MRMESGIQAALGQDGSIMHALKKIIITHYRLELLLLVAAVVYFIIALVLFLFQESTLYYHWGFTVGPAGILSIACPIVLLKKNQARIQ